MKRIGCLGAALLLAALGCSGGGGSGSSAAASTAGPAPAGPTSSPGSGAPVTSGTATTPSGSGTAPSGSDPALPGQAGAYAVPQIFPATDDWNTDISSYPVDPMSATYINSIGLNTSLHPDFGTTYNGVPNGIPFIVVAGTQPLVPIDFMLYASESDPGPYPYPSNTPIEGVSPGTNPPSSGGGDQHSIVIDKDHMKLYETWMTFPPAAPNTNWASDPNWSAANGAVWDLTKPCAGQRPLGYTSADAAGLPIFAGLVRYDEAVTNGVINHALRFTVSSSQNGFISPANHAAGSANTSLPPMGLRVRLKASVSTAGYPPEVTVILTALQKYGMIVADNGSSWFVSGAPDSRWNDSNLHTMSQLTGADFECVQTGPIQQ